MSVEDSKLMAAIATLTLKNGVASGEQRWQLAERCRAVGAIAQARALLDAECLPAGAIALRSALNGSRPAQTCEFSAALPQPIRLEEGFLPRDAAEVVRTRVREKVAQLVSSEIHDGAYSGVDASTRRSRVLPRASEIADVFLPYLRSFAQAARADLVGVTNFDLGKTELQITQHGQDAFFAAHSDSGIDKNQGRKISFVYYFTFPQRDFSGGDLRVFDGDDASGAWSSHAYTTIEPLDGRLVLFPSRAVHEVTRVESASADPLAGRFSINGWIH